MDSSLAYHEFKPSIAKDLPCRGGHCSLNLSRLKRLPVSVVLNLGQEVPAQELYSSLDRGSKLRCPLQTALMLLNSIRAINTHFLTRSRPTQYGGYDTRLRCQAELLNVTPSPVNWADIENCVEFLLKEMPDMKIDNNCLLEEFRRLNACIKTMGKSTR
ncbi:hypothetical protein TNCV_3506241 [Trichonephila clavipes]|uniref:Uncharacterized protein n=1 Tax=Trichonephila clavipes TaxID=2585209 RepID=A0A8X6RX68_TRICX|nr:hypothetical protein TNCV_3506241 [Trichonephila clavipes]